MDNNYHPNPVNLEQLHSAIRWEMRKSTPAMCVNDIENYKKRLDVVLAQNGHHIEHSM